MVQKRLFNYILKYRKKGYTEKQLSSRLFKDGWSNKEIKDALELVNKKIKKQKLNKKTVKKTNQEKKDSKNDSSKISQVLIKKRNPLLVVLFSIISLGIYLIYWLISTNIEIKKKIYSSPSPYWILFILLFNISGFSVYALSSILKISFFYSLIIALSLFLVSFILSIIYFYKYSEAINKLTGFNKILLTLLWILFWPVAVFISQKQLNKKFQK
ncbi:MAG: hypothetical protein ACOC3Z_00880 [Nanoarchaeota archaeon]